MDSFPCKNKYSVIRVFRLNNSSHVDLGMKTVRRVCTGSLINYSSASILRLLILLHFAISTRLFSLPHKRASSHGIINNRRPSFPLFFVPYIFVYYILIKQLILNIWAPTSFHYMLYHNYIITSFPLIILYHEFRFLSL